MNIPECQLEQNVIAMIPDLYGFKLDYLLYNIEIDPDNELIRSWFVVDKKTGYKDTAIKLIKEGKLKGNLNNVICPYTPDFANMWMGEINVEDMKSFFLLLNKTYVDKNADNIYTFLFWISITFIIGIICKKIYRRFYKIK